MQLKDLKYLMAYIVPFLTFIGLVNGGVWSFATVGFAFVIVPVLELLMPRSTGNYSDEEVSNRGANGFFDLLLYLNLPILYGALVLFGINSLGGNYDLNEMIGLVLSMGILLGTSGINVGHELGHRDSQVEQFLAKMLLLPALYMHFYIEHNRGHHKNVATPEDPSSARYDENLYAFWLRSVKHAYLHAWQLEFERLTDSGKPRFGWQNQMMQFTVAQLLYILCLILFFGLQLTVLYVVMGVISFLLLETINYVEHYGLLRNKNENGIYERVDAKHSWNSNHEAGRIILYELTRHSDHHFKANKKYQILEHHDRSPQLPYGYPTSVLLAMVPPLWKGVMNQRVRNLRPELISE